MSSEKYISAIFTLSELCVLVNRAWRDVHRLSVHRVAPKIRSEIRKSSSKLRVHLLHGEVSQAGVRCHCNYTWRMHTKGMGLGALKSFTANIGGWMHERLA